MKHISIRALVGLTLLAITGITKAALIVDTGPGPSTLPGITFSYDQWMAAEFTLDTSYTLTDAQAWMDRAYGYFTVAIYADGGDIPDQTQELYSRRVGFYATTPDWYGVNNVSWDLTAGSYWLAFEHRPGDTITSAFNNNAYLPADPMDNYAINFGAGQWYPFAGTGIGIRISASPVPVPAALWLFGSAVAGFAGFGRFNNKGQ